MTDLNSGYTNNHFARLRLTTLGQVALDRVQLGAPHDRLFAQGKVLALVVYLAAARGRAIPREQLADLLWGDESPETARGSLRQALYALRQAIGEVTLESDRERIRLKADAIEYDVVQLERIVRTAPLEQVLALYHGPFCSRLDIGGAEAARRWIAVERTRVEELFVDAVSQRLDEMVSGGVLADLPRAARALVAAAPENATATAVAYDALVAAGDIEEARQVLGAHYAHLVASDLDVPAEIARRVATQGRLVIASDAGPTLSALSLGREMVGRESELAVLISNAEQVRDGGVRRVLVRGASGSGKTRLLEEFEARLRLRGTRVLRVRALAGMHEVPLAALSDLLVALAGLPGALGISEDSASTLASSVPSVRTVYRGARISSGNVGPDPLALRSALAELLEAVTERRPLVLIIDDLHLADDLSRSVLASTRRGPACRLMEVWAARPVLPIDTSGVDAELSLSPLRPSEIEQLFTQSAPLENAHLADLLVRRLTGSARGLPQLVLSAARSAVASGLLCVGPTGWESPSAAELDEHLLRAVSPTTALEALSGAALRVLGVVALWNRPLLERDLAGIAALLPVPLTEPDVRAALAELDGAGVLRAVDVSWVMAHDTVREAMQETIERYQPTSALDALIAYWCNPSRIGVDVITALALLAGGQATWDAARRILVQASRPAVRRQVGIPAVELPAIIARAAGRPEWQAPLQREIGVFAAMGDAGRAIAGALAALALVLLGWLGWMLQPRLVMEADPVGTNGKAGRNYTLWLAQPSVLIENGFGRRLTLELSVRVQSRDVELTGDTVVTTRAGKAQFQELAGRRVIEKPDVRPVEVTFSGPWYLRPVRVRVAGITRGLMEDYFSLTRIVVNGRDVTTARELEVGVFDTLRFSVTYEFTTAIGTAYYVVGAAPSWVEGDRDIVRVGYLPTPVRTAVQTSQFTVYPPGRPLDSGYVAILSGREESVEYIFSATNWTAGQPIWGDGNDVMQLGAEAMEGLRSSGTLVVPNIVFAPMRGRPPDERLASGAVPRVWMQEAQTALTYAGSAVRVRFR